MEHQPFHMRIPDRRERVCAGTDRSLCKGRDVFGFVLGFVLGFVFGSVQDLVRFQNRQYSLDRRRCVQGQNCFGRVFVVLLFILMRMTPGRRTFFRCLLL